MLVIDKNAMLNAAAEKFAEKGFSGAVEKGSIQLLRNGK